MKTYAKILFLLVFVGILLLVREIGLTMHLNHVRSEISSRKSTKSANPNLETAPSTRTPGETERALFAPMDPLVPVTFLPGGSDSDDADFTSTNTTKLAMEESGIQEGQVIVVTVIAHDARGERRSIGGDFLFAVMHNSDSKTSTAGHVRDHKNGTYTVYFYAAWSGLAYIDITLVYTRQAMQWLYEFWQQPHRISWKGIYDNGDDTFTAKWCQIERLPVPSANNKCIYEHENALGKTAFVCDVSSEACENLAMTQGNITRLNEKAELMVRGYEHLFNSKYLMQKLHNGPDVIRIKANPKKSQNEDNLPTCAGESKQPIVHGYWTGDTWTSLICKLQRWEKAPMSRVKECLRGRDMYFLGDSTTRQFSNVVVELVGMGGLLQKRHAARTYRRVVDSAYDISFTFQHHPWAVGGSPYPVNEVRFEVDVIDSLQDSLCNYVILVGPYAHYTSWTREGYIERLQHLRESLVRFKRRCPNSPVFIKGSKPRDHAVFISYIHSNDFFLYEMNKLMKKVFHGIGAIFLDVWDMNLSYPAPNNIHMPMQVIRQEANLFLSYLCSDR